MNIAITGEGIVSAIGLDKASTLSALRRGESGIGQLRYLESCHTELPVGEVKLSNAEMKAQLGLAEDAEISRCSLMGALAIGQALSEAGLTAAKRRGLSVALISGTTVGGMDVTERHFAEMLRDGSHSELLLTHDCGHQTLQMGRLACPDADCTTISTACSAGANALALGAELLQSQQVDLVIAGGTECLSRFHLNGFNSLMILDHDRCRPFDRTRAGLNLGEGAAFVIMESEESALKRGAEVHAYLTGWGNSCDAFHQTATSPEGEGATLAMQKALARAGLKPTDISYINAHGTGTQNNDQTESTALRRVFGQQLPPVSSTKGYTGHTTSAAGAIEAVISVLALREQFIPSNLGFAEADPDTIVPSMGEEHAALQHVMSSDFGFGGNDTTLIFSSEPVSAFRIPHSANIEEVSHVVVEGTDNLKEIHEFVKPMAARRMGKLQKATLLATLKALRQAGLEKTDAIIGSTTYGCLENGERMLQELAQDGEETCSPTVFMQSTYNTVASALAIHTHCHGYNITYCEPGHGLQAALRDARLLLEIGEAETVLVEQHDETAPVFRQIQAKNGQSDPEVRAEAIVLRRKK